MQLESNENSLSNLLRAATQSAHSSTEGASFITKLFKGTCTEQEYYHYLWAMQQVYEVLETSLALHKSHKAIAPIYFEELFRLNSLEQDLKEWQQFKSVIPLKLAHVLKDYRNYLYELSRSAPLLLVAHAYVRYLGDLSGGQMLGKVLSKRFPHSKGLNFYEFQIGDINEMKKKYRNGLDIIGAISLDYSNLLCNEANLAFAYNGKIFEALSSSDSELEN